MTYEHEDTESRDELTQEYLDAGFVLVDVEWSVSHEDEPTTLSVEADESKEAHDD